MRPAITCPTTSHVCKTRGCQCSFRLLMMGGVPPETCWASYKYEIKLWYTVASCWIFLCKFILLFDSALFTTALTCLVHRYFNCEDKFGSGGNLHSFSSSVPRWRWVVKFTPLYLVGYKPRYQLNTKAWWAPVVGSSFGVDSFEKSKISCLLQELVYDIFIDIWYIYWYMIYLLIYDIFIDIWYIY